VYVFVSVLLPVHEDETRLGARRLADKHDGGGGDQLTRTAAPTLRIMRSSPPAPPRGALA